MPELQKQDADKNPGGYGAFPFPAVLSKVQAGDFNQCAATENINYQRARRKIHVKHGFDAEPIIRYQNGLSALYLYERSLKLAK